MTWTDKDLSGNTYIVVSKGNSWKSLILFLEAQEKYLKIIKDELMEELQLTIRKSLSKKPERGIK